MTADAAARRRKRPSRGQGTGQPAQQALRIAALGAPHLAHYLNTLARQGILEPDYHPELDRKFGNAARKNLIYRVDDAIFVHILTDEEDARDSYIAIDPAMLEDLTPYVKQVESLLLDYVDALEAAEDDEAKKEVLLRAVDENVRIVDLAPPLRGRASSGRQRSGRGRGFSRSGAGAKATRRFTARRSRLRRCGT